MQVRYSIAGAVALCAMVGNAYAQTVTTVDTNKFKQAIAANRGKVTLINFWATWCGPCVAEFPDLIKVYNKNKTKGLSLVTVSCDEPEDTKKVKAFLAKNGATSGYLNSAGQDITGILHYLEPKASDDSTVLPRTYVIDRKGKVVKILSGIQDTKSFQQAVAPYLK